MNKTLLISICTGTIIAIILAVFFITKDEENTMIDIQAITGVSEPNENINSIKAKQPENDSQFVNSNSIPLIVEEIKKNPPLELNNSRLIPDEPCPVDNFDVYVNDALQIFRKNLSDKDKDAALQNVDAIGMPMIMPVIMLALEDDNAEIRSTAVEAMKSLDDPCVIPAVEKAMDDSDPLIRQDAITVLLNVDNEGINDALIKAISDSDEDVRESAFEVMLMQESTKILPAAEAAVQIKNPDTQEQAISILEDIPSSSAIDSIINYGLLSDYDDIRDTASRSLQRLTGKNIDSYDNWVKWWDENKKSCPENLNTDEWIKWWKNR